MKICIPVETSEGIEAKVNAHFGSAPYFLIYDTEEKTFDIIKNTDSRHIHGMCHPLKTLNNKEIGAVVYGGMGARAVQKLGEGGIKAYRAKAGTVEEIIKKYRENTLEEITIDNACTDHNCH
jgi:predicted Fe-Mo cluster-binding NifX family protein